MHGSSVRSTGMLLERGELVNLCLKQLIANRCARVFKRTHFHVGRRLLRGSGRSRMQTKSWSLSPRFKPLLLCREVHVTAPLNVFTPHLISCKR